MADDLATTQGMLQDVVEECLFFENQVGALRDALSEERSRQGRCVKALQQYAEALEARAGDKARAETRTLRDAAASVRSDLEAHAKAVEERLAAVGLTDVHLGPAGGGSAPLAGTPMAGTPMSQYSLPDSSSAADKLREALDQERELRARLERENEALSAQLQATGASATSTSPRRGMVMHRSGSLEVAIPNGGANGANGHGAHGNGYDQQPSDALTTGGGGGGGDGVDIGRVGKMRVHRSGSVDLTLAGSGESPGHDAQSSYVLRQRIESLQEALSQERVAASLAKRERDEAVRERDRYRQEMEEAMRARESSLQEIETGRLERSAALDEVRAAQREREGLERLKQGIEDKMHATLKERDEAVKEAEAGRHAARMAEQRADEAETNLAAARQQASETVLERDRALAALDRAGQEKAEQDDALYALNAKVQTLERSVADTQARCDATERLLRECEEDKAAKDKAQKDAERAAQRSAERAEEAEMAKTTALRQAESSRDEEERMRRARDALILERDEALGNSERTIKQRNEANDRMTAALDEAAAARREREALLREKAMLQDEVQRVMGDRDAAVSAAARREEESSASQGRLQEAERDAQRSVERATVAEEEARAAMERAEAADRDRASLAADKRRLEVELERVGTSHSDELNAARSQHEQALAMAQEEARARAAAEIDKQRGEIMSLEHGRRALALQQADEAVKAKAAASEAEAAASRKAADLEGRLGEAEAALMAANLKAEQLEAALGDAREREARQEGAHEQALAAARAAAAHGETAERRAAAKAQEAEEAESSLARQREALREARDKVVELTGAVAAAQARAAKAEGEVDKANRERDVVVQMLKDSREATARSIAARRREQRRREEEEEEQQQQQQQQVGSPTGSQAGGAGHQVRVHRSGSIDVTQHAMGRTVHINPDGSITETPTGGAGGGGGGSRGSSPERAALMDAAEVRRLEADNQSLRAQLAAHQSSSPTRSEGGGGGGGGGGDDGERLAQLKRLTESIAGQRELDSRAEEWATLRAAYEQQVETLRGQLREAAAARDDAVRAAARAHEEARSARVRCEALDKERRRLLDEVSSAEANLRSGRQATQLATAQSNGLEQALEGERRLRTELADQMDGNKTALSEARRLAEDASSRATAAEADRDATKAQMRSLAAEVEELRASRAAIETQGLQSRGTVSQLEARRADLEDELARTQRQLTEANERRKGAETALTAARDRVQTVEEDRARLATEAEGAAAALRLAQVQKGQVTAELEQVYKALADLEKRLTETRADNARLRRELAAATGLSPALSPSAASTPVPRQPAAPPSLDLQSGVATGNAAKAPSPLPPRQTMAAAGGSPGGHNVAVHRSGSIDVSVGGYTSHYSASSSASDSNDLLQNATRAPLPSSSPSSRRGVAQAVSETEGGRTAAGGGENHQVWVHRTGSVDVGVGATAAGTASSSASSSSSTGVAFYHRTGAGAAPAAPTSQTPVHRARITIQPDGGVVETPTGGSQRGNLSSTAAARAYLDGLKRRAATPTPSSAGGAADSPSHRVHMSRSGSVDVTVDHQQRQQRSATPAGTSSTSYRSRSLSPGRSQGRAVGEASGTQGGRQTGEESTGDPGEPWMQGYDKNIGSIRRGTYFGLYPPKEVSCVVCLLESGLFVPFGMASRCCCWWWCLNLCSCVTHTYLFLPTHLPYPLPCFYRLPTPTLSHPIPRRPSSVLVIAPDPLSIAARLLPPEARLHRPRNRKPATWRGMHSRPLARGSTTRDECDNE